MKKGVVVDLKIICIINIYLMYLIYVYKIFYCIYMIICYRLQVYMQFILYDSNINYIDRSYFFFKMLGDQYVSIFRVVN